MGNRRAIVGPWEILPDEERKVLHLGGARKPISTEATGAEIALADRIVELQAERDRLRARLRQLEGMARAPMAETPCESDPCDVCRELAGDDHD